MNADADDADNKGIVELQVRLIGGKLRVYG